MWHAYGQADQFSHVWCKWCFVTAEETAAAEPFHGRVASHTSSDLRAKCCPVYKSVHAAANQVPCCDDVAAMQLHGGAGQGGAHSASGD